MVAAAHSPSADPVFRRVGCTAIALLLMLAGAFAGTNPEPTSDPLKATRDWQVRRTASLSDADGWLALAGLFPITPGELRLGAAADNDIVFPAVAAAHLGALRVTPTSLHFRTSPGVDVYLDEVRVDSVDLLSDGASQGPTRLHSGSLSWWVIERVDRRWLRLSDALNPALEHPDSIEFFPIAGNWRVAARLHRVVDAPAIPVPTVLGLPTLQTAAGDLQFAISGQSHHLQALDGGDGRLFIIFTDLTSGRTTYDAGRFLWADAPDETGHTVLDFNQAYNPPCAFSPFATCPLPPPGNHLNVAVMAGEKKWTGEVH